MLLPQHMLKWYPSSSSLSLSPTPSYAHTHLGSHGELRIPPRSPRTLGTEPSHSPLCPELPPTRSPALLSPASTAVYVMSDVTWYTSHRVGAGGRDEADRRWRQQGQHRGGHCQRCCCPSHVFSHGTFRVSVPQEGRLSVFQMPDRKMRPNRKYCSLFFFFPEPEPGTGRPQPQVVRFRFKSHFVGIGESEREASPSTGRR